MTITHNFTPFRTIIDGLDIFEHELGLELLMSDKIELAFWADSNPVDSGSC